MTRRVSAQVVPIKLSVSRFHEDPFPPLLRVGSRPVYPYPMQDDLTDEMAEREFQAVVLENGLLRLTVLPELGGHVLSLRDLVHDREVFYHNVPLKLGLVAMRGAWWAGGIEFNSPHVGHAVTTSDRVSWHVRENEDGSATAFVGAVEHLTRMAWQVALTLRPDDWRLHVRIRLFNRTPFFHRIYFWSNSAVAARDDFRLLLPATRVLSWWYGADGDANFPIHKGRDLSRYADLVRGGDIFAKDLRADWFGGYYEELDCGVVHQASRFEVPGRKMFSWGQGGHGQMWAELLNARGEPYIELQSGRFVHQGVHRLLAPGAVEAWHESWAPVWGLGGVAHAAGDLVLNAIRDGDALDLRLLALAKVEEAAIVVQQGDRALESIRRAFAPGESHSLRVPLRGDGAVSVALNGDKVTLRVEGNAVRPALDGAPPHVGLPDVALDDTPATLQGWLLKARGHEQRNDPAAAADCYRKALGLDPACVAAMTGLAQGHLRRGESHAAKEWANKALATDPQSEDALWWLGVATLQEGGEPLAALSALQRSARYAAAATALLGEMALRRREPLAALDLFGPASERNPHESRLVALAAFAARMGGAVESARTLLAECEKEAPLEPLLWSERHFLSLVGGTSPSRVSRREDTPPTTIDAAIGEVFGADPQAYLEAACDYERLGAWDTAAEWLRDVACRRADPARQAMLLYHLAHALWGLGRASEAITAAREAAKQSPLFVNPHRHEDAEALRTALQLCPDDALAHLLLGNCLASLARWDEAVEHWTRATRLAPEDSETAVLAWRNLALFRRHKQRNTPDALAAYSHALDSLSSLPSSPPAPNTRHPAPLSSSAWRLWLERDHVLSAAGRHAERVAAFDAAPDAVKAKWQVLARWADACLRTGAPERTVQLLSGCRFKPWEGEARPRVLWKEAHMALGHRAKDAADLPKARQHFESAADYPKHLSVGKPTRSDDADALFWAGWCAAQLGDADGARRLLSAAATEAQPRDAVTGDFKSRAAELLKTLG
ncbi:MAG TPA: DUF5107 domain-containing protein [Planctomycetota bacterium]|nr:DUF5107 domain-containing protein [Planctomycetota bacterium]